MAHFLQILSRFLEMTKQVPVITDKKIGNTFNIYGNNIFDTFCEAKRMPGVN